MSLGKIEKKFKFFFRKKQIVLVMFFLLYIMSHEVRGQELTEFKSLEFRGLEYISQYEILQKTGCSFNKQVILIDIDRLKDVLAQYEQIKSFNVKENDSKLMITVKEEIPFLLLLINEGENTKFIEVDEQLDFFARNRFYCDDKPLIFVNYDLFNKCVVEEKLNQLLLTLKSLRNQKSLVLTQLKIVTFNQDLSVNVKLKGRRTKFMLSPTEESFLKLGALVSYFDEIGYYPEHLLINDSFAVIK